MKLASQNRLTIPKFIIEKSGLTNDCYLIYESKNNFLLRNDLKGKVIANVKLDSKGRFIVPKDFVDFFKNKKIIIYLEEQQVRILCLKKDT